MRVNAALLWAGLVVVPFSVAAQTANSGASETAYKGMVPNLPLLSGNGRSYTEAFSAPEGTLKIQISHKTEANAAYMSVALEFDNNLDGVFCGEGDTGCSTIWQGGYADIQNVDRQTQYVFYGGRARYKVDAPGDWSISTVIRPAPMHKINGFVRQPLIRDSRVFDMETSSVRPTVIATSDRGERFVTEGTQFGDFELTVFGDTGYQVTAQKKAGKIVLTTPAKRVDEDSFLALAYPSRQVRADFVLTVERQKKTVSIHPGENLRLEGLQRETISIAPDKPLRLEGIANVSVDIRPNSPLRLHGIVSGSRDIIPDKPLRLEGLNGTQKGK